MAGLCCLHGIRSIPQEKKTFASSLKYKSLYCLAVSAVESDSTQVKGRKIGEKGNVKMYEPAIMYYWFT